ncbi:MAG: alpha/beta fold hydrolase [Caulobacter sp.]|nr:alpha/beta fold hydrolase [Caulobacter sp.]
MSGVIIMVHGVGGTGDTFSRLAPAFRDKGWRVETPTLRPDKRLAQNPPADLPSLRLKDYVDDIASLVRKLEKETGESPVLFGHSMGGLIIQKLAERGLGRALVLITPATPADARGSRSLAQAFTFANILFTSNPASKSHKIWRTGFNWGVLNRVPAAKHAGIFASTVYDSGGVYDDLAYPDRDPTRTAFIDETKISIPILVIGGARDRAVSIGDVRLLAEKYSRVGGDYLEYPDNAHWIVDEPGTDQMIADIDVWLTSKGLTGKAAPKKKAATAKAKPAARPAVAKRPAAEPAKAAKPVSTPAVKAVPAKKAAARKSAAKAKPVASGKAAPAAKAPAKGKTSVRKPKST